MSDPDFMDVLNPIDNLMEEFSRFLLLDSFALDDIVEELSILHELHNQKELFGGFDDLIELD